MNQLSALICLHGFCSLGSQLNKMWHFQETPSSINTCLRHSPSFGYILFPAEKETTVTWTRRLAVLIVYLEISRVLVVMALLSFITQHMEKQSKGTVHQRRLYARHSNRLHIPCEPKEHILFLSGSSSAWTGCLAHKRIKLQEWLCWNQSWFISCSHHTVGPV